ncbi:MAG: hypothetical protein P8X73_04475 [Ignavibacteriaceae bacterium]|jgi:Tol biopolymer transport system component
MNSLIYTFIFFATCSLFGQQKNIRQLTEGDFSSRSPVGSQDSSYIAFESNLTGNRDLLILEFQTGKAFALTTSPASDRYTSCSPDGKYIIYAGAKNNGDNYKLFRVSVE